MRKFLIFLIVGLLFTRQASAQVPDFTASTCDGTTYNLYNDLAAGNAVVLDFCAVWCPPCNYSSPLLQELYEDMSSGNCKVKQYLMLFDGPTPNVPATCSQVANYVNSHGITFPALTNIGSWSTGITGQFFSLYNNLTSTGESENGVPMFMVIIPNVSDPANSRVIPFVGARDDLVQYIKDILTQEGFVTPKISFDGELCSNDPYTGTLISNMTSGNVWSTGATTQNITINQSGSYTLSNTTLPGCVVSETVQFNPSPIAGTVTTPSSTLCAGRLLELHYADPSNGKSTAVWIVDGQEYVPYTNQSLAIPIPENYPVGATMTAGIKVMGQGECFTNSNMVTITIIDGSPPVISNTASASTSIVCTNTDYTLSYTGGVAGSVWEVYVDFWQSWIPFAYVTPGLQPHDIIRDFVSNNVLFRVKSPNGSCYDLSNTVEVSYINLSITANGNFCSNPPFSATLTANQSTGVLWSTGETSQTINVTASGTYSFNYNNIPGCSTEKTIVFNSPPVAGTVTAQSTTICPGNNIVLDYNDPSNGSLSTMWFVDSYEAGPYDNAPVIFNTTDNFTVGSTYEFWVVVTGPEGCTTGSNTVTVTVVAGIPDTLSGTASISSPIVCRETDYTLNYTGGIPGSMWEFYDKDFGVWTTFTTADQPLVNPHLLIDLSNMGDIKLFRVKSPNGSCYIVSNTVEMRFSPDLVIAAPDFACGGASTSLVLEGNNTNILWSTGETTASITVNPSVNTNYTVSATNADGCNYTASLALEVKAEASTLIASNSNGDICSSSPVELSFTGTNSSTPCSTDIFGQYPFDDYFSNSNNGNTQVITTEGWLGEYSMLNVEAGLYYRFTSSENNSGNNVYITITSEDGTQTLASGVQSVIMKAASSGLVRYYTHGTNCGSDNTKFVTRWVAAHTNPSGLGTFLWMPGGQTTESITVNPTSATNYILQFTDAETGCTSTGNIQITPGIEGVVLSNSNITTNSAQLNWTSSEDPDKWEIRYKSTNKGSKFIEVEVGGNQRSFVINSLLTNQNYIWQIKAKCGKKWTDYSNALDFITESVDAITRRFETETAMETMTAETLQVSVRPNPSYSNFTVQISSSDLKEPVSIMVTDILGRVIETRTSAANHSLTIGDNYKNGIYFLRIIKGQEMRIEKLVKVN